jgi:hypothetical protein
MAKKTLTSNVHVGNKWYGPDYPQNEVTAEVLDSITNPAAFAPPDDGGGAGDNRFRADDFGTDEPPSLRAGETTPPAAPAAVPDGTVPDGTAEEVLDWVGEDKTRAQQALDAEQAKEKPRKGLTEALDDLLTK